MGLILNYLLNIKCITGNVVVNFWTDNELELLGLSSLLGNSIHPLASHNINIVSLYGLEIGRIYKLFFNISHSPKLNNENLIVITNNIPPLLINIARENGVIPLPGKITLVDLKSSVRRLTRKSYIENTKYRNKKVNNFLNLNEFSTLRISLQTENYNETQLRIAHSKKTVYGYRQSALKKLGFTSPNQLITQGYWLYNFIVQGEEISTSWLCKKSATVDY